MILEKIERSLSLLFLMILILTQSLIWVASKAASEFDYDLVATYVEPTIGQTVVKGEDPHFQARLDVDGQHEFSAVFFTLTNYSTGREINFEASLQTDESYLSAASWSTNQYNAGDYYLSATAQNFSVNGDLLNSYQSRPQLIVLSEGLVQAELNLVGSPSILPIEFIIPSADRVFGPSDLDDNGFLNIYAQWSGDNMVDFNADFILDDAKFALLQGDGNITETVANTSGMSYSGTMDFNGLPSGTYSMAIMMAQRHTEGYVVVSYIDFSWQNSYLI